MLRKILVLGATGEIGGRIARGCVDAGHKVTGIARGRNQRPAVNLDGVEWLHGDKNDENFIRDAVSKMDLDVVIDSVPGIDSIKLYRKYLKQAENILICSSTGTFVPLRQVPADENHPWREETAVNFHAQSVRDAYALELWEREKFPVTVFRPTNIIGRDRAPLELWGGRDIQFFRLLKAHQPVTIVPCEPILVQSGYNQDLADAFVKAVDHPEEIRGEILIISCKKAITLGRYLQTAMEILNSKSEIHHATWEQLHEMYPKTTWRFGLEFLLEHMCFDIGKAERLIGYCPTNTTEQGLAEALGWCEETGLL